MNINTNAKKHVQFSFNVGEQLKDCRQKKGLSIEKISERIKVPDKYLKALENGEYNDLPVDVYTCGFLKKYAEFLNLSTDEIVNFYKKEKRVFNSISNKGEIDAAIISKKSLSRRFYITPRIIALFTLMMLAAIIISYFWYQVSFLLSPPRLNIEAPAQDIEVSESKIRISGRTDFDASVRINNQSITVNDDGFFIQEVDLAPGLNVLEIQAKNRLGKENKVVRRIVYKILTESE